MIIKYKSSQMQGGQYRQPLVQFMPFSFKPIINSQDQWKPSDYGAGQERLHNEEIRKSEYKFIPHFGQGGLPVTNSNGQGKWRLIRYQNGKFVEHEDKQINQQHIGTQILIFPKSKSPHQKGDLLIYNPKSKEQFYRVSAQDFAYVYVFIPLGYAHQVTEVEGTRTVATRQVMDFKKVVDFEEQLIKYKNNIKD